MEVVELATALLTEPDRNRFTHHFGLWGRGGIILSAETLVLTYMRKKAAHGIERRYGSQGEAVSITVKAIATARDAASANLGLSFLPLWTKISNAGMLIRDHAPVVNPNSAPCRLAVQSLAKKGTCQRVSTESITRNPITADLRFPYPEKTATKYAASIKEPETAKWVYPGFASPSMPIFVKKATTPQQQAAITGGDAMRSKGRWNLKKRGRKQMQRNGPWI